MRKGKRKKLAARGWKIGSAREFLRLSPEETAYIELSLKRGASNRELAAIIGGS